MASGKLGSAALTADTNTTIYTVPADTVTTLNVSVVNRGINDAVVSIALSATGSPANADYIEYGVILPGNGGVLERTALVAGVGERVVVRSSTGNCSARVHGFEEGI